MSLYRTNSDRGLWKKYRSEQPKHFHKPCYIGKEQEKTQVTYSQLQLGEDDGFHRVLNSRNSNFSYYKNASKSAPATPRATTPTRQHKKYSRMMEGPPSGSASGAGARPVNGTASAAAPNYVETGLLNGGHPRPVTSNSVYSQDVDENASSWDSRSLGRDSALGPYMSAYREPQHRPASEDFFNDRPNPFLQGSNIANEADNVVQMFLMSMNNRQNFSPPDQPDDHANNKTILAQMRKDFFTNTQQSPEKREQTKVTNKYLKPENLYVPSSKPNAEDQVVQSFVAPQMHHAEVVHVRQDSTSTEASMEASFDTQVSHHEDEEVSKKKGFLKSLFNKKSSSKKAIPTPPAHANFQPEAYQDDDVDYDPPPMIAAPLERKRSMSKPTDLDEILRLQEEEEQRNVNNIFANDPFFNQNSGQPALPKRSPNPPSELNNSFTVEPLYENRFDLNTTQEIDIDAALGYCDEEAIDNIDWPKTEEDQVLPVPVPQTELTLDYAPPPASVQSKSKRSFFSFGTKKKKSPANVEVSYYVNDDSPPILEQPQFGQNDELEQPEYKDTNKKGGSFFKFKNNKTKESKMKESMADDLPTLELGDSDLNQPKLSLFNFKSSKTVKKHKTFEDDPITTPTDDDKKAEELPIQHLAEESEQVPVLVKEGTKEDEEETTTPTPVKIDTIVEFTKSKPKSPGFFSFKGKSSKPKEKAVEEEHVRHVPINIEDTGPSEGDQEELNKTKSREELITKPSFFSFKSKSRSREVPIQVEPEPEPEGIPNDEDEEMKIECNEIIKDDFEETLDSSAAEIAELGPIKEEQPSFSRPPSAGSKSSSRPAKRKGLSGLFKSKKSPQQSLPKQIGTMQPVDVSHLVDADDIEVEPGQPVGPTEEQPMDRSRTRRKSGGLSAFFSNRPNTQTQGDNFTRNDRRSRSLPRSSKRDLQDLPGQQPNNRPQQRHPPPKSKSMGGFFNLQPKHPRRPQVPPPAPPSAVEPSEPIHETNSSRAASRTGSMSSLASGKRRETKGISNFLGTSPLRKSNRMPRSQTFPKVPQPNGQMVSKPATPPQELRTRDDTDKIEIASVESTPPTQNQDLPPRAQQGRVMGRRSGRFRKNPEEPSQLPKGPHTVPPRPEESSETDAAAPPKQNKGDSTEHSVARDLFAQAVNKPPAVSIKSGGKTAGSSSQPFPHADNEYDQAVNKVNRNDSYRRAGQMRNYNSLPRLGNRKKDEQVKPPHQIADNYTDPETRSLDGRRRRHQRPSNDNCQMM